MRTETTKQTRFRIFLGIVLLALGLLGTVSLLMKEISLALFGEHSSGTVQKVEVITTSTSSRWVDGRRQSRSGSSTIMHIAFTTKAGEPFGIKTTATFRTEAKAGDQHPMIYLPWRPQTAKIYSAKQLWLPMITQGFQL